MMMQSSSSSDDESLSFNESSLNRTSGYGGDVQDLKYRVISRPQHLDETDSIVSNRSRQATIVSRVKESESLSRRSGFEPQHSIPQTNPLATRTSSMKVHRPMPTSSSASIYSFADDNRSSHQAVTLQTPVLSAAEDRSSSDRSNQWSSSDLSSIRSCSIVSVPVTSYDTTRPYEGSAVFGTSASSYATSLIGPSGEPLGSSRYPSTGERRGTEESNRSRSETTGTSNASLSTGPSTSADAAEDLHKLRLQLYVFVLRCIAYPFTVPLPQDPVRRYLKVTREYLTVLRERFAAFLNKELQIVCDEAFFNAVLHFDEIYLRNESVERAVIAGGFSMNDIREVFVRSIEQRLERFEEIDGLPKQTVIGSWKVKFDQICRGGEGPCPIANRLGSPQLELTNPTKEQLYDLFMRILSIKKYEHQILYNACQLDNVDEQAAQIRRELADRKTYLEEIAINRRYPKMVHKEMEVQYVEEQIKNLNQLMLQLDTVPVGKSHGYSAGVGSGAVGVVVQLQRRLKKYSAHPQQQPGPQNPFPLSTTLSMGLLPIQQNGDPDVRRGAISGLSPVHRTSIMPWVTGDDGQQHQMVTDGTNVQLRCSINHIGGNISKMNIQLSFNLQIMICQLRPLRHLLGNKQVFCTIEVEGCPERQRTASVKAAKPIWDTLAEFETSHPLPCVKLKLLKESSGAFSLDHKELGRIVLMPNPSTSHLPTWYKLQPTKRCNDEIELQVAVKQERPSNLKHCGFCWVQGRSTFKKWKIRYICLIQVSQYTFIMAAFKEAKSIAYESMVIEGYTVDYCEVNQELLSVAKAELATESGGLLSSSMPSLNKVKSGGSGNFAVTLSGGNRSKNPSVVMVPTSREVASLQGGEDANNGGNGTGVTTLGGTSISVSRRLPRFFFNLVKEGDTLTFAVFEETELHSWVQAIHRATGQSHKPVPTTRMISKTHLRKGGRDSAHHLGVSSLVAVKPYEVDHLPLLKELFVRMLEYRNKDPFVSLGWLSPSQSLVLDEYCNRYSIRECQRNLLFLNELLNYGEQDLMIDIELIFQSYVLCADHVQGKTKEKGINTVLNIEMDDFQRLRARLLVFLEKRLTGFRFHFPFNRPEGGLEKLLALLDRVIAHSNEGSASVEAVRSMVRVCLRNAAVLNYEKTFDLAQQEAKKNEDPSDAGLDTHVTRLRNLLRLSEICIDTLQQNDDYFAKSFIWYGDLFVEHSENFLSLFQMDMSDVLDNIPADSWGVFQIFQFLNGCLLNSETLANGQFHSALLDRFAPIVENYLSLMETSITKFLVAGIEKETWVPLSDGGTQTESSDLIVGSSISSQTHPETDTESYPSVSLQRRNRSIRHVPTNDGTGTGSGGIDSSSPPPLPRQNTLSRHPLTNTYNGLKSYSARTSQITRNSTVVGPTSAFLNVLSRSRPLAFVSRVMNPTASIRSASVNMGRQSVVVITPPPTSASVNESVLDADGERMEHSDLAAELACARCCRTVGTLIFRLYALKDFIEELGWPERVKASGWADSTRRMCSSLLREAAKRTLVELDSHLRQSSKSTELIVPLECLTMINTITAIRMQLFSLCHRNESEVAGDAQSGSKTESPGEISISQPTSVRMYTETEAFLEGIHRQMSVILTDHLAYVLTTVLNRLARYDEGNLISSILTLAKPVDEDGRSYTHFISANLQILCQNLVDDVYLLSLFENWYTSQLRLIQEWLTQRRNNVLHAYQIKCLATIVRKVFSDFELQGVATHVLENMTYKNVCHRLQVEEATLSVSTSTREVSSSSTQSAAITDGRQNLIRVIGGGLSSLAQGAGLRPRQN
nr:calcium dependent secretion activator 1 [Hymenolepis microstoma]